ncbi:Mitotic Spindle Assembly Checkpoint Protein Mad2A [Manis pentadactyla]|nr:Mitotic Spindle Assembly Checkpoint Protein Mad2A [Manis pentadactyla]
MALQLSREQGITLRGSAEIVAEFFSFGINSILYQRGIYPSETFTRVQKYGLTLLVTTDPELIKYLNNVVEQLKDWLYKCSVQKLVVIISNIESGEVLERWQFDIECDKTAKDDSTPREKSQKAIQDEIRSVIRQITATVTFLPLLEVSCSFDLLIYTDKDLVVPEKWEESGPQFITNSEEVRLRSFTTTIHKVFVHLPVFPRNKKIFKIKHEVPLNTVWTADSMGKANIGAQRSFILGWPTVNFVATFRYIHLAKEKDQPKSISLDIFTEDIKKCTSPLTITVKTSDTVNDVINMSLQVLGVTGSEEDYQLWVTSDKEKTLYPLIGHEHPYGVKMSHLRALFVPQELQDAIFPFILKTRQLARNQQRGFSPVSQAITRSNQMMACSEKPRIKNSGGAKYYGTYFRYGGVALAF